MVDGRHCASLRPLAPPLTLHGVAGGGEGGDPPLAHKVTAGLLRVPVMLATVVGARRAASRGKVRRSEVSS